MSDQTAIAPAHGMADTEPGLRLHYVTAGDGARTIVLLHGFPQTWWQWRQVIPALVEAGYRVVVPDYRGAGHSWRPASQEERLGRRFDRFMLGGCGHQSRTRQHRPRKIRSSTYRRFSEYDVSSHTTVSAVSSAP